MNKQKKIYLKFFLTKDRKTMRKITSWPAKEWISVDGEINPCVNGLHLATLRSAHNWSMDRPWVALAVYRGQAIKRDKGCGDEKLCVRSAKLVTKVYDCTRILTQSSSGYFRESLIEFFTKQYPEFTIVKHL